MRSLTVAEEAEFQSAIHNHLRHKPVVDTASVSLGAEVDSRFAVMTRIKVRDHWTWTTWMCFATYAEATAHARQGNKVVRFHSPEWAALRQQSEAAPPIIVTAPRKSLRPRGEDETLVEFVLRFLSARGFSQDDEAILSEVKHGSINPAGDPVIGNQEDDTAIPESYEQQSVTVTSAHMIDLLLKL